MFEKQSESHIPEVNTEMEQREQIPEAELQRQLANQWADEYQKYFEDRAGYKERAHTPEEKEHVRAFADLAHYEIIPEEIRDYGDQHAAVQIELARYEKELETKDKAEVMKECAKQWLEEMWRYTQWAFSSKDSPLKGKEELRFPHPFGSLTRSKDEQMLLWEIRIARDKYQIAVAALKAKKYS